jgi:hypothetical protein
MEDGRWKQLPEPFEGEERRQKREKRWKIEDRSNCPEPFEREENKKCPVLGGDHASHSVTPDELWTLPAPINGPT